MAGELSRADIAEFREHFDAESGRTYSVLTAKKGNALCNAALLGLDAGKDWRERAAKVAERFEPTEKAAHVNYASQEIRALPIADEDQRGAARSELFREVPEAAPHQKAAAAREPSEYNTFRDNIPAAAPDELPEEVRVACINLVLARQPIRKIDAEELARLAYRMGREGK